MTPALVHSALALATLTLVRAAHLSEQLVPVRDADWWPGSSSWRVALGSPASNVTSARQLQGFSYSCGSSSPCGDNERFCCGSKCCSTSWCCKDISNNVICSSSAVCPNPLLPVYLAVGIGIPLLAALIRFLCMKKPVPVSAAVPTAMIGVTNPTYDSYANPAGAQPGQYSVPGQLNGNQFAQPYPSPQPMAGQYYGKQPEQPYYYPQPMAMPPLPYGQQVPAFGQPQQPYVGGPPPGVYPPPSSGGPPPYVP